MKYQILLYYKYVEIEDPEAFRDEQKQLCQELELKGRILVAKEGINGTVEGTEENTEKYVRVMQADERFTDMHFKRSVGTWDGSAFPKLSVKARDEIVSTYLPKAGQDVNPNEVTGKYLTADELQSWYENGEEFYVVDMRNDYEHKAGYFENTIFAPFENFRDLPKVLDQISHLKDKRVITVCTGGIRCEKASGFLVENGFTDVYQLHGGMHTYMERYPNQHFLGKLFVFDGRMVMGFNTDSPEHVVVGRCDICSQPSEHYINCSYVPCHRLTIACKDCLVKIGGVYCSEKCKVRHEAELAAKQQPLEVKNRQSEIRQQAALSL